VLFYGSNGWIGQQFTNILKNNNIKFVCGKSRVDNFNDLNNEINQIKPTHIVSFIGRTHGQIDNKVYTTIDYLEQDGKLVDNIRDNLYGPLLLSQLCKQNNIHFTYLGTGCIFKFDDEHPSEKKKMALMKTLYLISLVRRIQLLKVSQIG
jgi:3,5-epimerase/4-reductase